MFPSKQFLHWLQQLNCIKI